MEINPDIICLDAERLELRKRLIICEDNEAAGIIEQLMVVTDKICEILKRDEV